MSYTIDYNDDYLKQSNRAVALAQPKYFNYFTKTYSSSVLENSFIKFNENAIKIQKLEEKGKDTTKLYSENRLILASIKYFQTKLPCNNHDKVISWLNHLGVNRQVRSFNYFNNCAMALETQENILLENDGKLLLEGICAATGEDFKCSYTIGSTTYYKDDDGSIRPISSYTINTENYG